MSNSSASIVLFLDSSTLRSIAPSGELFTELLNLANKELILLRIHDLVLKEVATGLFEEVRQAIEKVLKTRKNLDWIVEENTRLLFANTRLYWE